MGEEVRFWLSAILLGFGVVCCLLGILGVYHFKFVMNRMHCAAIIDTLGIAAIIAGLIVASGSMSYIPKLLAIVVILWVGSPIASHLVGRLEVSTDDTIREHMEVEHDNS